MRENRKKIFVIGVAHSGTTILYKMLALHPDLAWFCKYSQRRGRTIPGRFIFPFASAVKKNLRRKFKHDWRKGKDDILIPTPSEMNSLWKYLWTIKDLEERGNVLKEIVEIEMDSWKKQAIIVKSPWIEEHVDFLNNALQGDCSFIHIVRDGRAVVPSILHKHQRYSQGKDALESAIRYWTNIVGRIIEFGDKSNWQNIMEVRYEDLVEDIPKTLANIMAFCGLDSSRFPFDRVPKKLQPTNPKWINVANRENIRLIEKGATELLQRYRYIAAEIQAG